MSHRPADRPRRARACWASVSSQGVHRDRRVYHPLASSILQPFLLFDMESGFDGKTTPFFETGSLPTVVRYCPFVSMSLAARGRGLQECSVCLPVRSRSQRASFLSVSVGSRPSGRGLANLPAEGDKVSKGMQQGVSRGILQSGSGHTCEHLAIAPSGAQTCPMCKG